MKPLVLQQVVSRPHGRQQAQSLMEFVLALPLIIFVLLSCIQLLWLFLAKQVFLSATSYVALFAAVEPENHFGQQAVFQQRIRPVQKELLVLPKIRHLPPSKEISQLAAQYDPKSKKYYFTPNYARLQLAEALKVSEEKAEAWLQLSHIAVEITWCFQLKVPLVGAFLSKMYQQALFQKDQSCLAYQLTGDYIPLKAVAKAPLHAAWSWQVQE